MENIHTPYYSLTIHPDKINVYYQTTAPRRYRRFDAPGEPGPNLTTTKQPIQFRDNYHQGRISSIAKRKMSKSIGYLIHLAKPKRIHKPYHGRNFTFKVNFITLSLSSKQIHTDQEIKAQLFHQFITEMCKRWNVEDYVWRAEKQKNGNIHFHIVTSKFIPWNELRNVWNRIQQKLGYVTRYRENRMEWHQDGFNYDPRYGKRWSYAQQRQAYKDGMQTGWDNPNSVDIHSLRHIGNIKAYFIKYLSKNEEFTDEQKRMFNALPLDEQRKIRENNFVTGRLWSCSNNLVDLPGGNMDICSSVQDELHKVFLNDKKCVYNSDYFHVYTVNLATLRMLNCFLLIACFEEFIRKKFPDRYLSVIT
ncbi:hypothetical protein ES705_20367 [subsurface metagenome]